MSKKIFTQKELEEAFEQMADEYEMRMANAHLAASILTERVAKSLNSAHLQLRPVVDDFRHSLYSTPNPLKNEFSLEGQLSGYHDWDATVIALAKAGAASMIKNHKIEGYFDLSEDIDFANASQKIFPIKINRYSYTHF